MSALPAPHIPNPTVFFFFLVILASYRTLSLLYSKIGSEARFIAQRQSRTQGPEPNCKPAIVGSNSRVAADLGRNGNAQPVPNGVAYAEIVVVRHGETEWNADGRIQGHLDIDLNEIGRRQATAVGERLSRESKISTIYSSDQKRALETANQISTACDGLEVIKDPGLRERNLGELQGLRPPAAARVCPEAFKILRSQKTDREIPVGFDFP